MRKLPRDKFRGSRKFVCRLRNEFSLYVNICCGPGHNRTHTCSTTVKTAEQCPRVCAKWDKVSRCWSKTYEECRSQLSWPTVQQRHQLLSCCQTFKIIHVNLDCLNFNDYLCFNQSSTRSHSLTLRCTRSRINSLRYSFFVNIPFLWNTIPYDIVNSTLYAAFKYKLKSFFFN